MNLVGAIGHRTVYSNKEAAQFLGLTIKQVQWLVYSGKLVRRHSGMFPFSQQDLNSFLTRLNAGQIKIGRGRKAS
jgi:hypothetical protein